MRLTRDLLKSIILKEVAKFKAEKSTESAAKEAEEVDAGEYADTLENPHNYYKALGLEEARLEKRLKRIKEAKAALRRKI